MIFSFSIKDFGHPKFLKSQFGHPVVKILAKSLPTYQSHECLAYIGLPWLHFIAHCYENT